ncbi:hypothetical protein C8J56DRAFT_1052445 [Mycena floridula]|nr:hypothetical protein C8J56DRAFT_1052445 [Mycena floridula]
MNLLYSFKEDIADLTPRRLLRNPASQLFLVSQIPHIKEPMFMDLHPSLSNLDHLGAYIHHAQDYMFPEGTGWQGLLCLKAHQDESVDPSLHYIRSIREFNWPNSQTGDYEEHKENMEVTKSNVFKIVLCMFPQRSADLLDVQYLQSDISHKRIAGWKEFVLVSLHTYTRLFINSSSAEAHQLMFAAIREQVRQDTGQLIKYQHIHSPSIPSRVGILHWVMDQDRGQAKGLGLHLQEVARLEAGNKPDLHQPWHNLAELGPYEQLHRLIRICVAHFFRNIHRSKASEDCKTKMRSLSCINHLDLQKTIDFLNTENWIQDKITSKFAIEGLCQKSSFIPLDIWQAGDSTSNGVEASHCDVNHEGMGCFLVGGIMSGRKHDLNKLRAQQNRHDTGIASSYRPGHIQVSINRSVNRKHKSRRKSFEREDKAILKQNDILSKALKSFKEADTDLQASSHRNLAAATLEAKVRKRNKALQALQTARDSSLEIWKSKKGSGDIQVMLE